MTSSGPAFQGSLHSAMDLKVRISCLQADERIHPRVAVSPVV